MQEKNSRKLAQLVHVHYMQVKETDKKQLVEN